MTKDEEHGELIHADTIDPAPGVKVVDALPDHDAPCPECGGELFYGYGLAGGGMGGYVSCDGCDALWKVMEDPEDG